MLSILDSSPLAFLLVVFSLIFCITIHEFAHAYIADKLGDDTPRLMGRISLNPLAHLDPIGSLMLIFVGFGWGKPVQVNPYNFKNTKRDMALVAFAGPASNLIFALITSIILHVISPDSFLFITLYFVLLYNISLAVFNLLPFHPLDGFKIVGGLLNNSLYIQWMETQSYGLYILMFLVITGSVDLFITPITNVFFKLLLPSVSF